MSLLLSISDVSKNFGGNDVLKGCSFSFDKSGTYVLTGPNGSGKSTLLRICALLEEPDAGSVNFFSGGAGLEKDVGLKRRITLVLPKIGVFNTTVRRNVAYGLKIRGLGRLETEHRVEAALKAVNLAHKRDQNALTLSSGETQRLGIARAIAVEPEILFLDEPTAFVDHESKAIIEEIVLSMKKEGRAIIVIATHDRSQAERLGDEMLVMEEGKINI